MSLYFYVCVTSSLLFWCQLSHVGNPAAVLLLTSQPPLPLISLKSLCLCGMHSTGKHNYPEGKDRKMSHQKSACLCLSLSVIWYRLNPCCTNFFSHIWVKIKGRSVMQKDGLAEAQRGEWRESSAQLLLGIWEWNIIHRQEVVRQWARRWWTHWYILIGLTLYLAVTNLFNIIKLESSITMYI